MLKKVVPDNEFCIYRLVSLSKAVLLGCSVQMFHVLSFTSHHFFAVSKFWSVIQKHGEKIQIGDNKYI